MKILLIICCWAITTPALSQPRKIDFFQVDQHALSVEASTLNDLSLKLTDGYKTDLEKTRAIFRWITENIAYRTASSTQKKKQEHFTADDNDTAALKPLDERVAETVLKNRQGVCDGYARLFKTLCEFSGIRSEVVYGYARTETFKRIQRFRSNHAWNAVYIDSSWQLLDVTWASGYIDRREQFVRFLDEQYFLTSPAIFIREHYPDDLSWTLMHDPPLMPEFKHSPFRQRAFVKYRIEQYTPATGVIEAEVGDTLHFELRTADYKADQNISANPFLDQSLYSSHQSALIKPVALNSHLIQYDYKVISASVQWIYLLYNDDLILRYRVKIKMPGAIPVLAAIQ